MRHLHLLVSDLLPPQDIAAQLFSGLHVPALEKLLARSEAGILPAMTLEEVLCAQFAAGAVAPVRALADGLDVADGFWLCADPVHLQLQQSQVVLQPDVRCEAAEAAAMCDLLNAHFAADGLVFYAPHPQRWYVRVAKVSSVTLTPLRLAAWRDVKPFQPQGADALHWKRLSNEIQMLLHDNPVNQAREEHGLAPINSLWLWGAGQAFPFTTSLEVIGGDEELNAAFASASGIRVVTSLAEMLTGSSLRGCWVNTELGTAWQRGDLYAWRETLQMLEQEIARPIWQALRSGRLQGLTLDVSLDSGILRYELSRAGIWKLWRRPKSLAKYDAGRLLKNEGS